MNPFKYGQIVKGNDFCKRTNLEKEITNFIKSGQNIVLQGERRVGKTSLIHETATRIKKKQILYIDFLEVKSIDNICKRIIKSIISLEQKGGMLEKILKSLSHLRPTITLDPITSQPTISISQNTKMQPDSLEEIMDLVFKMNNEKSLIVIFDEFQDILNIKENKEIFAILRSKIQFHSDIPYIFLGSIRNKMYEIFNDIESPFFKAAITIEVGNIEFNTFKKYLEEKFNTGKRKIENDLFEKIFDIAGRTPGDVQQLCSSLWEITSYKDAINESHLNNALELIYSRESKGYEIILSNLTELQLKCLAALAKHENTAPLSAEFLRKAGGILPASAKKAFTRMEQLKIIHRKTDNYKFINPFFKSWLIKSDLI